MIKLHSLVLIICSIIGVIGHYLQFDIFRITACIPATIGLFIYLTNYLLSKRENLTRHIPFLITFIFGSITTIMSIKFLPQDFQPLRKIIIFTSMSLSAWTTIIIYIRTIWVTNKK